jgi:AmiR/NasT family two-component response regulator
MMGGRGEGGDITEQSGTDPARLNALIARQRRDLDRIRSEAASRSVVDLARGVLMEQLRCSPAEAREQLARLASDSGQSVAELAAQITRQLPPEEAEDPGLRRLSAAMAICWPEPTADFSPPLRRQLAALTTW